jgi:toxin ParE1/3/4
VRITYREAARDDVTRQFRYYLVTLDNPAVAMRFREAVKRTADLIKKNPFICPSYFVDNPRLQNLRSWPVIGFDAIRVYFLVEEQTIMVVRFLHGSRNVRVILEREQAPQHR